MLARPVRPSGGMVVVRAMETYGMPRSEVSRVAVSPRFPQRGGQAVEQGPQGLGPRGGPASRHWVCTACTAGPACPASAKSLWDRRCRSAAAYSASSSAAA